MPTVLMVVKVFTGRAMMDAVWEGDHYKLLCAWLLLLPFLTFVSIYAVTLSLASWVTPDLTHHVFFSSINHHLAHSSHIPGSLKQSGEQSWQPPLSSTGSARSHLDLHRRNTSQAARHAQKFILFLPFPTNEYPHQGPSPRGCPILLFTKQLRLIILPHPHPPPV